MQTPTTPIRKIFFPDLDGWRFVAFLAVFYHHSFYTDSLAINESSVYKFIKGTTLNGNLGVDFFFVLSGFLIIYLLISEREATGRISALNFYIRRVLRIFPLYYGCVFFGFVLFPILKSALGAVPDESAHLPFYLAFLGNFDVISNGALPDSGVLGVLWSVAIEEQFYLTIPIVLIFLPVRFYQWVFIGVLAVSWIFRANYLDDYFVMTTHTLSFAGNLAIGGLIAYYSLVSQRFLAVIENLNPLTIKAVYLCAVAIFFFRQFIFAYPFLKIFDTSIIAVLFALIILEQNYAKGSFFKMRNNRLFSYLGKFTYGLYCLHMIAALVIIQLSSRLNINLEWWAIYLVQPVLMLALSIVMAYVSYRWYEKPFLNLKKRFVARD